MNKKIFIFIIPFILTGCGFKKALELPDSDENVQNKKERRKSFMHAF